MFLIMGVTLYTSRVILKTLGISDFGIYNVVGGIVTMFGFLNAAMSMGTQRFLNYEMGKNNSKGLKNVFIMSVNIHIIIAIIVLLFAETLGLWFLNAKLNIPVDRMQIANWVYQFSIFSFIITIIQVPYNAAIIAHERMNIYAYISIVEVLLKLLIVYLLVLISVDKLKLYAFLVFAVTFIVALIYRIYCIRKFEECRFSFFWDKKLFMNIMGFSGWNLFGQIAQISTTQGVNMVLNMFYGVVVNAAVGITNQINGAITSFVHNFQTAFRPQITKLYASNEKDKMNKLVFQSSKFSFFLLYLVSIPIIFNIEMVLKIWLGDYPAYSPIFCELLIIYSYMEAIGMPLVITIMASGKNRNYQVIVSIIIFLNLILSYFLLKFGLNPDIVFYVKIFLSFFVLSTRMYFSKKQSDISLKEFSLKVLWPVSLIFAFSYTFIRIVKIYFYDKVSIIFSTLVIEVLLLLIIYFWGMNKNEKFYINNSISKLYMKYFK
ncbi:MAG: lipopolysaccharide biosynthesis protein [Prevotellaceae bacterium]|jgi:O-antigen/teichoic acid export membrane protein|nr:lipopolysaccharide biosynthesis protein [Prevotellaceae bacterium]